MKPASSPAEDFPLSGSGGPGTNGAPAQGLVFVLSGPSGVGKSTLIRELKRDGFPIAYCVTATTRTQRDGEQDGRDYYFLSAEKFEELLQADEFLEHSVVHQRYRYGVPRFSLRASLALGQDVIMTPEVQGAAIIRQKLPRAVTVFLRPTSVDELAPRLDARQSETPEERAIRLQTAEREMARQQEYEYVVENRAGYLSDAVEDVKAIIRAERLRVQPRTVIIGP